MNAGIALEHGLVEHDVVRLPLAGFAGGVDEGWVLSVNGAGLSIGVVGVLHVGGVCLVAVEHLNLVHSAKHEHAGVAAALTEA